MRYASIRDMDISNGVGVGASVFLQGCSVHCKNCFQQQTWDFNGGKEWTEETTKKLFSILDKPYIKRLTFLGGEPLDQARDLFRLLSRIRSKYPKLKIWIYTGRTVEENNLDKWKRVCMLLADVIVDGPYMDEQKNMNLKFRGSNNQRIIDVCKSVDSGKIVLIDV